MSEINKDKIITLLNEANKALTILKEYKDFDKKELLASYKDMSVIKYHFIISIISNQNNAFKNNPEGMILLY